MMNTVNLTLKNYVPNSAANEGICSLNDLRYRKNIFIVNEERKRISIVGLGSVGVVSAACLAKLEHEVVGIDSDANTVRLINRGLAPFVESGLPELLKLANRKKLLSATDKFDSIIDTDVSVICVGAANRNNRVSDLSDLRRVSAKLGAILRHKEAYHFIIYRSAVPPTTTRDVMIPILEQYSGKQCGEDFGVCFIPEFLSTGTAVNDFEHPSQIVIGAYDQRSREYASILHQKIEGQLIITSIEAAEIIKYADENWHMLRVKFSHEISHLCTATGVNGHGLNDFVGRENGLNYSANDSFSTANAAKSEPHEGVDSNDAPTSPQNTQAVTDVLDQRADIDFLHLIDELPKLVPS